MIQDKSQDERVGQDNFYNNCRFYCNFFLENYCNFICYIIFISLLQLSFMLFFLSYFKKFERKKNGRQILDMGPTLRYLTTWSCGVFKFF